MQHAIIDGHYSTSVYVNRLAYVDHITRNEEWTNSFVHFAHLFWSTCLHVYDIGDVRSLRNVKIEPSTPLKTYISTCPSIHGIQPVPLYNGSPFRAWTLIKYWARDDGQLCSSSDADTSVLLRGRHAARRQLD